MLPILWKKRRMWRYVTIYSSIHGYFLLVVKSGRIPCVKLRRVNRKTLWGLSLLCKFPKRRGMGKFSLGTIFRNNKFHWNCARSNNDIYSFYVLVLCLCRCAHRHIPSHSSHVQVFTKSSPLHVSQIQAHFSLLEWVAVVVPGGKWPDL